MARFSKTLPQGNDATQHLSLGILALNFPTVRIQEIIKDCDRCSQRVRDLPAAVVVFYILALSLFTGVGYESVLRWLLTGLQWFGKMHLRISGKGALSAARTRLGEAPLKRLFEKMALPLADPQLRGSFCKGLHLVAWDGSTLALQDTKTIAEQFGRPSNQYSQSAWPQARFVALVEIGTHLIFAAALGGYRASEIALAQELVGELKTGMLCLADRLFPGFDLWQKASAQGAHLLWRAKVGLTLKPVEVLSDGSYLADWLPESGQRKKQKPIRVRVIEYRLQSNPKAKEASRGADTETYRLMTTILDPSFASAEELAQLYPERWEIELSIKETKTGMRGGMVTLRSKTPELVRQEFWGLLLAHYAVRKTMALAALDVDKDPDRLSFAKCIEIVKSIQTGPVLSFPPSKKSAHPAPSATRHGSQQGGM
jgi:hypothetical protein